MEFRKMGRSGDIIEVYGAVIVAVDKKLCLYQPVEKVGFRIGVVGWFDDRQFLLCLLWLFVIR